MLRLHICCVIALVSSAQSAIAQTCYYPNGQANSGLKPCNTNATVSSCCKTENNICLSNGLCFSTDLNTIIRRGCTDPSWNSAQCPQICVKEFPTADALLTDCDDYNAFCCGQDPTARACCNSNNASVIRLTGGSQVVSSNFPPPALGDSSSSGSAATVATATSIVTAGAATATTTITTNASADNCSALPENLAIALGCVLGLTVLILGIVSTCCYNQGRKLKEQGRPGRRPPMQ